MKLLLFYFLFFSFQIFCINPFSDKAKSSKPYQISDVISLIKSCKTKGYKIVDPKNYISEADQVKLEKELKEIYNKHKVITFIIMLDYIDFTDYKGNILEISNYTNLLIEELYVQEIVSIDAPIIVAVISIKDKKMTMRVEGRISHIITEQDSYNILNIINNYYAYGEYSYGSIELGKLINYYLTNTGFWARNKKFFFMIFLLVFCFVFCYVLSILAQKIKDRRNLRLTMSDEEKLLKIKEFLKKAKADRKILSDNCIICLEPFDNCVSIFHTISQDNKKQQERETKNNDNLMETEKDTYMNTYTNTNRLVEEINIQEENNINNENSLDINNAFKNRKKSDNNFSNNLSNNINDSINQQRNSVITDTQISTLPCGHRFHVKCISQWMLQKKNICPMCREKINVDIPENDDEDLQNELLNIQIELHPAFALLVFQTINEELTWGAITLPVINGGLFGGIAGFAFI